MSLSQYLSELWAYAHTKEYREGLFVEASGLVLDVLLLIVGVKVVAYYLARQSRGMTSVVSSFFIAQFLREVLVLQLKSGGVAEINTSLRAAAEKRELDSLFSHFLYGNTENLMDLLRLRMKSGEHIAGHKSLTAEKFKELSKDARSLLERLDSLLVILASLRQEDQCLRAYEFRLILTAVADYLEDLSDSDRAPPPRTYAPMSTGLASILASWFQICKRTIDRRSKGQIRRSYARLFLSVPREVSYRFLVRRWQRLRGHPYTDPFSSNFPQLFCNSLALALGSNWSGVVAAADVDKNELELLATQHRDLSQDEGIALLEKLRPHVSASVWNGVLAASLISDIDSRPISIVEVEAAKAEALYYLFELSTEDDSSGQVIEQTFQSLWNLRPSAR
jgi:hypothetical protein